MQLINSAQVILGVCVSIVVLCIGCSSPNVSENLNIALRIEHEKLNPETIQVGQRDEVTLNIQSDTAGLIHIHGYDIQEIMALDQVSKLRFVAHATGRFKITLHIQESVEGHHSTHKDTDSQEDYNGEHDDEQSQKGNHNTNGGQEISVGLLEVRPR